MWVSRVAAGTGGCGEGSWKQLGSTPANGGDITSGKALFLVCLFIPVVGRHEVPGVRSDELQVLDPGLPPPWRAGVNERLAPVDQRIEAPELQARRRVHQNGAVERQEELAVSRRVGANKQVHAPELRVALVPLTSTDNVEWRQRKHGKYLALNQRGESRKRRGCQGRKGSKVHPTPFAKSKTSHVCSCWFGLRVEEAPPDRVGAGVQAEALPVFEAQHLTSSTTTER